MARTLSSALLSFPLLSSFLFLSYNSSPSSLLRVIPLAQLLVHYYPSLLISLSLCSPLSARLVRTADGGTKGGCLLCNLPLIHLLPPYSFLRSCVVSPYLSLSLAGVPLGLAQREALYPFGSSTNIG